MTLDEAIKMTDEDVNLALARFAGWKLEQREDGEFALLDPSGSCIWSDFGCHVGWSHCIYMVPRYTASLDSHQPIVEGLDREQQRVFGECLYQILNDANRGSFRWLGPTTYHYSAAKAPQRARALLVAVGGGE